MKNIFCTLMTLYFIGCDENMESKSPVSSSTASESHDNENNADTEFSKMSEQGKVKFVKKNFNNTNIQKRDSTPFLYFWTGYISAIILIVFLFLNENFWHWFIIPVFICGILIGSDTLKWIRGKFDTFDPKGIIGILGWHSFFLAPLLFIYWDVGMRFTYTRNK